MSDSLQAREIPLGPGRAIEFTLSPQPEPKPDDPQASVLRRWWQQLGPSKPRR